MNFHVKSYQVVLTEIHQKLTKQWRQQWTNTKNPNRLLSKYHNRYTTKIHSLINVSKLNKSQCGMIIRLISEHIELNDYLFSKQIKDPEDQSIPQSPFCDYCNEVENVEHFLTNCKKYQKQREILYQNLTKINHRYKYKKFQSVKFLLFPYKLFHNNLNQQTKVWKEILSYTKHTNRFSNLYDVRTKELSL